MRECKVVSVGTTYEGPRLDALIEAKINELQSLPLGERWEFVQAVGDGRRQGDALLVFGREKAEA